MTYRFNALTVALSKDIRDDDAEKIIEAIKQLKGVEGVTGNIVDPDSYVAEMRVKNAVSEKLYEALHIIFKQ